MNSFKNLHSLEKEKTAESFCFIEDKITNIQHAAGETYDTTFGWLWCKIRFTLIYWQFSRANLSRWAHDLYFTFYVSFVVRIQPYHSIQGTHTRQSSSRSCDQN